MDDDRDRYRILEEERRRAQRAKEPERPTTRPLSGSPHAVPMDSMSVMQPEVMRRLEEQRQARAAELARGQKDDPVAQRRTAEAERAEQQRQAINAQHEARSRGVAPQATASNGQRPDEGRPGETQAGRSRDERARQIAEEAKLRLAHQMSLRRGRTL